jgi:hypothetical protein
MQYQFSKYGFRIRSRTGMVVDNLAIHGRDEAEAERKLRRMYPYCEILECRSIGGTSQSPAPADAETVSFEEVIALVTK